MNNCMFFHNDFCCVMILVFDQCKTKYLLIRALCYSTQQNMKKVLLEYESWIGDIADTNVNKYPLTRPTTKVNL